jgi:hypothetical protein
VNLYSGFVISSGMASWRKGQVVQLVPMSQATGRVLDVYRDMQQLLGVPHVSSFFQFLGSRPHFLDHFWSAVRPVVQSQAFVFCSSRLRAAAYTRVHTYFQVPDLKSEVARQQFSPAASEELKECIDLFCYSVPASLLLASLLSEAFEGPAGDEDIARTPAPAPKSYREPVMVEEGEADPTVQAIYADIRSATGADVVHTAYQALARWPGFLQSYWGLVKPIAVSDLFQYCQSSMREDALAMVSELPGPVEFDATDLAELGMNPSEVSSLIGGTNMFARSLAASLLNVTLARIALEGGSLRSKPTGISVVAVPKVPSTRAS